jgi:K+ transport systems, NAD-binding component
MKIAVAGAGSVGRAVAKELDSHRHQVTLIDKDPSAIRVSELPTAEWALADAGSPRALEEAGVRGCDAIVCATGDDKVNLVISMLAKTEFSIPKVVARVNDPNNEWMFTDTWGVDIPTSTPRVMATLVEDAITVGTAVRLSTITANEVGIYSVKVPEQSPVIGKAMSDVNWPSGIVIAGIARSGTPVASGAVNDLRVNDEIIILAGQNHFLEVEELESIIVTNH